MKRFVFIISLMLALAINLHPQDYKGYKELKKKYIQLSGKLFQDVQLSEIFPDSKTFVDAVPLKDPEIIRKQYDSMRTLPDFNLGQFVNANFQIPGKAGETIKLPKGQSMVDHIDSLWKYLIRKPDVENQYSTLIPLKYPYIVPGGRFREIYYWDSFFTILGLLADGKVQVAENMAANFAYLLDNYKMIPNGNRVYYLTRSQPPFFSLMVDIICRYKKDYSWGVQYLKQLQEEYSFWMEEHSMPSDVRGISIPKRGGLSKKPYCLNRVVIFNDGSVLNRYYDFDDVPREESYKEDYLLSQKVTDSLRPEFCRNLRAAAESGWDFSSRWFRDGKTLSTIHTTDILPVDLNCLLYFLEDRLSFFYKMKGDGDLAKMYADKASKRKKLINKLFWDGKKGYYFDYDWKTGQRTGIYSLAGCYPLYFGIAKTENIPKVVKVIREKFLMPGGLKTTPFATGQQWDAPNGWPPLQWITIKGLREYAINNLADTVKHRWLNLNETVYKRTGRMLEKYNVENLTLFAGGGEYPLQDGFGWTNGVASALISNFDKLYLLKNERK